MPRDIGFLGSVALLVSNMTGPSLAVIPLLFQKAGWFTPLLAFAIIALLTGTAALFLVEAMSSIEGNERFQASIEFATIAHLLLGNEWHTVVQVFLYLAMQTLVIASLLEAFQSMDAFLISVAHKTCAISFTDGWVCINQMPPIGPSAFSGYILGSVGTLIILSLILPLSLIRLVDNIIFQVISFILLLMITIIWIVVFAVKGFEFSSVPVVGHDQSNVVGFVLSNFSFVMTIPTWVNEIHPSVNIRLAVWTSILTACLIYIPIGWMGGYAFDFQHEMLLEVLVTSTGHGTLSTIARVSTYAFPLAVLVTSVPVYTIVIRHNLLRGNICSNKMAIFWSAIFPWLIVTPLQTKTGLGTVLNWTSLIFASPSNLLIPFVLFIASKRFSLSQRLDANIPGDPEISLELVGPKAVFPVEDAPTVFRVDTNLTAVDYDSTEGVKEFPEEFRETATPRLHAIPSQVTNPLSSPSGHTPALFRLDTNSTVLNNDSMEVVKTVPSEESEEAAQSMLVAIPMSRMSLPSRRKYYKQALGESSGPFLAFPTLCSASPTRSTYVSAVGFLVAAALILLAVVYNIAHSVDPSANV